MTAWKTGLWWGNLNLDQGKNETHPTESCQVRFNLLKTGRYETLVQVVAMIVLTLFSNQSIAGQQ